MISSYIDHTLLSPNASSSQIDQLCLEAKKYNFHSVCVNLFYVKKCAEILKGTDVKVCSVVGFPLGQTSSLIKAKEAEQACIDGADEIDMVMNISAFKDKNYKIVSDEIKEVRSAIGNDKYLKVIIECCLLDLDEIRGASQITVQSGADCVKTSTGFSLYGAKAEHVRLMRNEVGKDFGVKASGGIRNLATFMEMIDAGASRIGCSSSCAIVLEELQNKA